MITLAIAICTSAALDICEPAERIVMPPSTTMFACERVAAVIMYDEAGKLIIAGEFKKATCEKS